MSSDMELNPGPAQSKLEQRLQAFQLRSLDVGCTGNCFFRAVSRQLYGDLNHHLEIRTAGIVLMRNHPERFIESNTDCSWLQYLKSYLYTRDME